MTTDTSRTALVIGGTGMLAAATRWLAIQGYHIALLARRPETLAREIAAAPVPFDWHDSAAARQVLATLSRGFDLGVIWLHDDAVWLDRPAEDLLAPAARVIRVHGALSTGPAIHARREPDPRPGLARQSVILGWHPDPKADGGRRWLTDKEISGGVIEAMQRPASSRILVGTKAGV